MKFKQILENLSEARVDTIAYEATHGKDPGKLKLNGPGNWFFSKTKYLEFDKKPVKGEDYINVRGKYSEAKKEALKWAKEKGYQVIYVQG